MNNDVIQGKWQQLKGRIREQWGLLSDDDLDVAQGHREYLVGKVQERYGVAKDKALEQVREFEDKL